jgi:hypothetical protein
MQSQCRVPINRVGNRALPVGLDNPALQDIASLTNVDREFNQVRQADGIPLRQV